MSRQRERACAWILLGEGSGRSAPGLSMVGRWLRSRLEQGGAPQCTVFRALFVGYRGESVWCCGSTGIESLQHFTVVLVEAKHLRPP